MLSSYPSQNLGSVAFATASAIAASSAATTIVAS